MSAKNAANGIRTHARTHGDVTRSFRLYNIKALYFSNKRENRVI